jgi:hypothetical protein
MLHYMAKTAKKLKVAGRGWMGCAICHPFALLSLILAGAGVASAGGQAGGEAGVRTQGQASQTLATRVVAYQIEARLDPVHKTVDATEILTYHNLTGRPLDAFPFHLYLNAFQPTSTFMREVRG